MLRLLDALQGNAFSAGGPAPGRRRWGRRRRITAIPRSGSVSIRLLLKEEAPAIFTGIDRQHRADRHFNLEAASAESGREQYAVEAELQSLYGTGMDVEGNPALLNISRGHLHPGNLGIYQNMRSQPVVYRPLINGPYQIRPGGTRLWYRIGQTVLPHWSAHIAFRVSQTQLKRLSFK